MDKDGFAPTNTRAPSRGDDVQVATRSGLAAEQDNYACPQPASHDVHYACLGQGLLLLD
jgi:hypothetical protein